MLTGGALALVLASQAFSGEWLDAEFDWHHPVTKFRPSADGQITAAVAYALRKDGPKRRANHAKPAARLAVFADIGEHRARHKSPREALGRAPSPR